ncbi:MAG: hypothetical protein K6T81_16110 [Alicyclobacillus macrosporangiidus]|uniref:hypothetical protein n=1 Tax=Alicyclobacillus macrosporangiidus TaxID=392015 RepID=UPI0026F0F8BC|nr:hypothetical protein [Alicyclobacillus macrosporangiidus]MCL6600242.1 hypothetical protein [Alicyclobacillus macrosporangiidus]
MLKFKAWTGIGAALLGMGLTIGMVSACGDGASAPSNEEVKQVQTELKDEKAGDLIAGVHSKMNDIVGWNHYEVFKDPQSDAWNQWDRTDSLWVKQQLQQAEAAVKAHGGPKATDVVKDLENAIKLVDLASKKHDYEALLYIHRIVSDLGQFAYGHYTDYHSFGSTNLFHGSNVAKIQELIGNAS